MMQKHRGDHARMTEDVYTLLFCAGLEEAKTVIARFWMVTERFKNV